jgi:hypothetical protein
MKAIVKLVIAALVIHATWRAGSVYMRYYQFRDEARQIAQFQGARPESEIHERVLEAAARHQIPVDGEAVSVTRRDNHTYIDATYTERIELLPRYFYPWEFRMNVDAFTIAPK